MNLQALPEGVIEICRQVGFKPLQVPLALNLELLYFVIEVALLILHHS